jgi:hypothetical protein
VRLNRVPLCGASPAGREVFPVMPLYSPVRRASCNENNSYDTIKIERRHQQ